ncbi:MAG: glycoside hydrolase family 3 C-terminal domain-containing protein [Firmicutes bacterium]|nr:glycoside hydrolase family 3 C-terminal domain-containing protein [Bacillota bacterium]
MDLKDLVGRMTLEQKCSMLSGKSFWETMDIANASFKIPSAFLADGPHGIRKQAGEGDHLGLNESLKATCFPTAATMANSFNIELGEQVGVALGREAVVQKVNVLLGPGLNVKRNPLCGRNFEYFSEDPYLAGKMAASYARGIQSNGVSSCLKHYAANNQETRRMVVDTIVDERALREIYLTNFEIGVKEGGTKTIMSAYNKINGEYANENKHLLVDVLRDDWKFPGVIVSDWGGDNDRVAAMKVGAELEMPTSGGEGNRDVYKAVLAKELDVKVVDEAVERLLKLVFDTEDVFRVKDRKFDKDAHHALALKAAEDCIVLLENKNNALPLKAGEKVALVGDFAQKSRYQGAGSSGVNPTKIDTTLQLIEKSAGKDYGLSYVGFQPGFERFGKKNEGLKKKAVEFAAAADTVLVYLGLGENIESEGGDRKNMKLPDNQKELLAALKATGKKIIAVLSCGAALEVDFSENCDALIHGYLGGQAGAGAMLNVLTGKVSPSGKLSESYPLRYEDCSSASNFPCSPHDGQEKPVRNVEYRESIYVGYRYYDAAGIPVKYPFGFGLSYTAFAFSDLLVGESGATFTIKNTGAVAGAEVAQLYIGLPGSKIFRAKKELKGFKKIFLQPGESKSVTIPFDEYSFRYFNVKTDKWETEAGTYDILIGSSCADADIKLKGLLKKEGTTDVIPYDMAKLPTYAKPSAKTANVPFAEFKALYGKDIPDPAYPFYKPGRMLAERNTAISELKYARGWIGRLFASVGGKFMILGMDEMPLRALVRFGGPMSLGQVDGLRRIFNGGTRKISKIFTIGLATATCTVAPLFLLPAKKVIGPKTIVPGALLALPGLILSIPALIFGLLPAALMGDLSKFFKEGKLKSLEGRLMNLKLKGAHEFDIWKAEKRIGKLKKKGAEKNKELIASLEADIKKWSGMPASRAQILETEMQIDAVKAKLAKIDAKYEAWQKKFEEKQSKK